MSTEKKMEVEIWSDVMCPFCYIGKRRFEKALKKLPEADKVKVTWKSFQLNPDLKTQPEKNIIEHLAEIKGWSIEQSTEMHANVTNMAKEEGLDYRFDKAVVANSFDAHRLLQMAKTKGLGDQAEELLFKYYFTEGKNIADHGFLTEVGVELGLNKTEVEEMLSSDKFSEEVNKDIYESHQLGVRGVPFFVMNQKYGISGAQPTETFVGALEQSLGEWKDQLRNVLS